MGIDRYSCARRVAAVFAVCLGLWSVEARAQSLPAGWSTADVGNPALAGNATEANGTYTVSGAGVDVWGAADQFRFVHRQLVGDGVIVARVVSLKRTHVWAKAGVMIRESVTANAKNAFMLVSAAKGLAFTHRASTGGATVLARKASGAVAYWVKLERKGSTFTASASPDGVTWKVIGTKTVSMSTTVYAGLAVTSVNSAAVTTATFTNVALTTAAQPPPPTNAAPSISIQSPGAGATVSGTVPVSGTASDEAGVAKVEVRIDGGAWVAATGKANWSYAWDSAGVPNGTHTVAARATDTGGLSTVTSVGVTVSNVVALPGSAAGTIPTGYPRRFAIGLFEDHGGTWMRDSGVRWDVRYRYFVQGWLNNWGWSAADGSWGLSYLRETAALGMTPVVQYYVMNGVSGYNEGAFLATVQNPAKMADYFNQWKILMQRVRDFGLPTVIMVEADGFGFLQQQTGANPHAYAAVAASGIPELAGLPNTVAGWGLAFLELRAAVGAHNAILAMDISGWATGKDILYFNVTDPLSAEVDRAYNFLAPLGLAPNQTGATWDLLAQNPLDRDSDYYTTLGQNRWWDASDTAPVGSRSFNRYAEWLRLWNVKANKRWVLWQVPLGNSNHLNVFNNGGARQGYKDNRPEYFLGSNGDAHRRKFAEAGVIGVFFGGGAAGMSGYGNDIYTDGQLFMKSRGGAFLNTGGLPID
jgi:hypothetical protein